MKGPLDLTEPTPVTFSIGPNDVVTGTMDRTDPCVVTAMSTEAFGVHSVHARDGSVRTSTLYRWSIVRVALIEPTCAPKRSTGVPRRKPTMIMRSLRASIGSLIRWALGALGSFDSRAIARAEPSLQRIKPARFLPFRGVRESLRLRHLDLD